MAPPRPGRCWATRPGSAVVALAPLGRVLVHDEHADDHGDRATPLSGTQLRGQRDTAAGGHGVPRSIQRLRRDHDERAWCGGQLPARQPVPAHLDGQRVKTYAPSPDGQSPWSTSWHQVVKVDVDLHMLKGHDISFPDNADTYWAYVLGRQGNRDPWRILDQGVG